MSLPTAARYIRLAGCAFLCAVVLTGRATVGIAQVRLVGRVVEDSTGQPIEGVLVTVLDSADQSLGQRRTSASGTFAFLIDGADAVRLRAERIGYQEVLTSMLYFERYDQYRIEIIMDPSIVLLAPLVVVTRSNVAESRLLTAFRERVKTGLGRYFTREDIERLDPAYVTDVLATVPGVRLRSSGPGAQRTIFMGRAGGCPAQIYVDGMLINVPNSNEAVAIDEIVSPLSVEGIEIYRGLSTVPPEFLNPKADCGVIAIWTRRGDTK